MKIVTILSGGMDSTTLVYDLVHQMHEVHCLSFNYGQRHSKELEYAARTCDKLGLTHKIITLPTALFDNCALTYAEDIPEGHYTDDNMKKTVVPNRNMVMLSLAAAYAINIGADAVAYGAHSGDHAIYPDCRPEFYDAIAKVFLLCDFKPLQFFAPYMYVDKGDIAILGKHLGVPYEETWTCYKGGEEPCGVCGACVERSEAMAKAAATEVQPCLF